MKFFGIVLRRLTASYGGKLDHLIKKHNLKYCKVVFSQAEAAKLKLKIDHDDKNAWQHNKPFSLLIHGTQMPKSPASKALSALRQIGITGYSKKNPAAKQFENVLTA